MNPHAPGRPGPIRPEAAAAPDSGIVEVADYGRGRARMIPLHVGEGDRPTPAFIVEAATRSLSAGDTFYTWQRGIPELRQAIATYMAGLYGGMPDPERFFVTIGGMHALQIATRITVGAGEEILIPTPCWPNFDGAAIVAGATPVSVPMSHGPAGWRLDIERLAGAITPRTRALAINSPANPTGWTATIADLRAILDLARRHGLWIIADEIYGRFVHGPEMAAAGRAPSFKDVMSEEDRILFLQTFSKNWAMTGWRIGWLEAPRGLGTVIENLVQYSTSGVPGFIQKAALTAITEGESLVAEHVALARRNRQIVCDGLGALNVVDLPPPPGAFYAFFSIRGIRDTRRLALDLIDQAAVGLAPGTAFGPGGHDHVRLCYLRDTAQIEEAVARLRETLPKLAMAAALRGASPAPAKGRGILGGQQRSSSLDDGMGIGRRRSHGESMRSRLA